MDPSPSAADPAPAPPAEETSRLSRISRWLKPTLVVALLTFAAGVVFGNVLPTSGELAATQRRLDDQREENERLKKRIADLTAHAQRLEKDPWLTERILRDQLKMSADGEVLIR
jgi:cell division protein FtsB